MKQISTGVAAKDQKSILFHLTLFEHVISRIWCGNASRRSETTTKTTDTTYLTINVVSWV